MSRGAALLREIALFLLFLALSIALTWPLAIRLQTAVPDFGDPLLNTWIIDWVAWALTHQPLHLFQAPIFYPAEYPLAFSENLIGIAIFAIPMQLAGLEPLTIYNILLLLGFAHAGYGAFVLARVVTKTTLPAIIGGIFFAFVSYKFDQLSHLQVIWSGWLPLMLAAVIAYWRTPSIGRASLVFGAFVMNGLTNIHFLLFGGVALAAAIVVLAILDPNRTYRFWLQLGAALLLAGLVLLPVLLPYRHVAKTYEMKRARHEVEAFSAEPSHWLHTTTRSRVYGKHQPRDVRNELTLFPGLVPLFLLAAAIIVTPRKETGALLWAAPAKSRFAWAIHILDALIVFSAALIWFGAVSERFVITLGGRTLLAISGTDLPAMICVALIFIRLLLRFPRVLGGDRGRSLLTAAADSRFPPEAWAAAVWIVIGFLGSLGLNAFFHSFLYQRVPAFEAIRVPARWAVITYAGLAVWMAIGARTLLRRKVMAAILPLLIVIEVLPHIRWEHAPVRVPPFYHWLDETRVGPVLELPPETNWSDHFLYLLYATEHRVPIMNGTSGFEPPLHYAIRDAYLNYKLDASFTRLLEENGARTVVLHGDSMAARTKYVTEWLQEALQSGRLAFLRRFDHDVAGDWVFAVTKNFPDWKTYQGDREPLARFLQGKPTYNASTFGWMESPRPHEVHTRQLRVAGWALSPHGISSATVLIDSGRLRVPMQQYKRPDVVEQFPWYPNVPEPGLIATLPKRPKGTPRLTDIQIEIVDGRGEVTHLRSLPFQWN